MGKTHHLKALPVYFDAVLRGDKPFEIRKNDRGFQTGDMIVLEEFDPATANYPMALPPVQAPGFGQPPKPPVDRRYTGKRLMATISYTLHPGEGFTGLEPNHVILGLTGVARIPDEGADD